MVPSFGGGEGLGRGARAASLKNLYTWYFVIVLRHYTFERLGGM